MILFIITDCVCEDRQTDRGPDVVLCLWFAGGNQPLLPCPLSFPDVFIKTCIFSKDSLWSLRLFGRGSKTGRRWRVGAPKSTKAASGSLDQTHQQQLVKPGFCEFLRFSRPGICSGLDTCVYEHVLCKHGLPRWRPSHASTRRLRAAFLLARTHLVQSLARSQFKGHSDISRLSPKGRRAE